MRKVLVVTEGASDAAVLKVLLRTLPVPSEVVSANGRSSALSLARTLAGIRQTPTVLVIDADSTDPEAVEERRRFLRESLSQVAPPEMWRVIILVPELEIVFFDAPEVLAKLIGRKPTPSQLRDARYRPKEVLVSLFGLQPPYVKRIERILRGLDPSQLWRNPALAELKSFVLEQSSATGQTAAS